ncbi:MAG: InlB B-repeat-containing protein [Ruminococcus sp.]|jgi:hypothetical protein|nr:InlB B-repeat-containing protein [Ruminococcus sp.]
MSNLRTPIIAASIAIAAVIITIVVLVTGGNPSGIYVSNVIGSVSIADNKGGGNASADLMLAQGDIITVGPDSSCTITYRGRDNSEENYIVVDSNSQIIVNSKFSGNNSGELFLNRGTVITNLVGDSKGEVSIRTANAMVYVQKTVSKVAYYEKDGRSYTDIVDFMGNSTLQLYDVSGNTFGSLEPLLEKRAALIITGDDIPYFEYLNLEFSLSVLTASDLKSIITVAQLEGELFPYPIDILREAYTAAAGTPLPPLPDQSITSEPIITATPLETLPIETTTPPAVTEAPPNTKLTVPTLAPPTTRPPATTAAAATTVDSSRMLTVILAVGDDESIYEVPYGGALEKPDDPVLDGFTFTGWDRGFTNITEDCTITAQFSDGGGFPILDPEPSNGSGDDTLTHTVTVVVAGRSTTVQVVDGESAKLQTNLQIDGYRFLGWDKDFSAIYEDTTITAILEPINTPSTTQGPFTVTFIIDGIQYPVEVAYGGSAIPPFYPSPDSFGNEFTGWDKPTSNITANTTITAVYAESTQIYTVTFNINGMLYDVQVREGEAATPPFTPTSDMLGRTFTGWDKSLLNIRADQLITAQYQQF